MSEITDIARRRISTAAAEGVERLFAKEWGATVTVVEVTDSIFEVEVALGNGSTAIFRVQTARRRA